MPHKACGEVLRHPCAFTLGDEPFAGGVEHRAPELWMASAQVGIPLHNLVHAEVREQPTRLWQDFCLITDTYFKVEIKSGPESGPLRSEGRHLYSRTNFKLNRAAALAEWRQLLGA